MIQQLVTRKNTVGFQLTVMFNPFHDVMWSLQQGKLHEFFLKDSLTLATWGLVVATVLLVADSWRKGKEQQRRWDREDEQHANDRVEERARWKRDDDLQLQIAKQGILKGLALQFSSAEILRARTDFAHNQFGWNGISRFHPNRRPAELAALASGREFRGEKRLLAFFTDMKMKFDNGDLQIADVDHVFGEYLFHFAESISHRNSNSIEPVMRLRDCLRNFRTTNGLAENDLSTSARKSFWFYEIDPALVAPND